METDDFKNFVKRWTITVTYIAFALTVLVGLRIYELFLEALNGSA